MPHPLPITVHTIVKNEDQWLWYSLQSVLPFVKKILVFDDNSVDNTTKIINALNSSKIIYEKGELKSPADLTEKRNELVRKTETNWFMLLDGDEVWNKKTLQGFLKFTFQQPDEILSISCRTRNVVGDAWHYLPESAGQYNILGKKGHLTTRVFRKGQTWHGDYPLETYGEISDVQKAFFDGYYWHMTYLKRSSVNAYVKGWRKIKYDQGLRVKNRSELPEVFGIDHPSFVPDPFVRRSVYFELISTVLYLPRKLKNLI